MEFFGGIKKYLSPDTSLSGGMDDKEKTRIDEKLEKGLIRQQKDGTYETVVPEESMFHKPITKKPKNLLEDDGYDPRAYETLVRDGLACLEKPSIETCSQELESFIAQVQQTIAPLNVEDQFDYINHIDTWGSKVLRQQLHDFLAIDQSSLSAQQREEFLQNFDVWEHKQNFFAEQLNLLGKNLDINYRYEKAHNPPRGYAHWRDFLESVASHT